MSIRTFVVPIALICLPLAAQTAEKDDFNPYRNTKVGDFAIYKINTKVGGLNVPGTISQTVIAKTDKEATLKVVSSVNGMEVSGPPQVVDLTKPYDPTKGLPPGFVCTLKKAKDGQEKLKVLGKDYDTNWTSYDLDGKVNEMDIKGNIKVWFAKEITIGLAKMEMTVDLKTLNMETTRYETTMEPTEVGNKK
jgi:hypothetical protein